MGSLFLIVILLLSVACAQMQGRYLGCFHKNTFHFQNKLMNHDRTNSGDECRGRCEQINKGYSGTKNGNECFCTDDPKSDANCDIKCTGNAKEMCGGKGYFSVYKTLPQIPSGYLGCFHKSKFYFPRKLENDDENNSGVTCKSRCDQINYKYAGTKNGKECYCTDDPKSDAICDIQCTGNANEMCGGKDYFSVYETLTQIPDGYLGCFHKITVYFPHKLANDDESNSGVICKSRCDQINYRYAGTKNGKECYCTNDPKSDENCDKNCTGNAKEMCGGKDYYSVYETLMTTSTAQLLTNITETSMRSTEVTSIAHPRTTTTTTTMSSTNAGETRHTETSTTTVVTSSTTLTETTSITTASGKITNERVSDDDGNGSVVAAAVIVPVIILIATAIVIALFIFRRRRQKSIQTMGGHPGTSITNKNYEGGLGLSKRISLLNMRTSDSADNAYTEITLEDSDPVDTAGSVYQTIDSLPEDQAESSSGYGHLKIQATKVIDKNYSHFPINQTNGNATRDTTYAHTENATNEQVVNDNRDDNDNTYNRLETTSKTNTGKHIPEKQAEGNADADAVYNHAKAGLPELTSENNADTYSHLNSTWQKTQTHPKNSFELFAQNAKTEREEKQPMAYETQKESETGPYEFENSSSGDKRLQNVGHDGYETAIGHAHDYFVLEPENGKEMSFHVVEENAEEKDTDDECAKHHQYFTLEKTET